jgi:hypothetical protein
MDEQKLLTAELIDENGFKTHNELFYSSVTRAYNWGFGKDYATANEAISELAAYARKKDSVLRLGFTEAGYSIIK